MVTMRESTKSDPVFGLAVETMVDGFVLVVGGVLGLQVCCPTSV